MCTLHTLICLILSLAVHTEPAYAQKVAPKKPAARSAQPGKSFGAGATDVQIQKTSTQRSATLQASLEPPKPVSKRATERPQTATVTINEKGQRIVEVKFAPTDVNGKAKKKAKEIKRETASFEAPKLVEVEKTISETEVEPLSKKQRQQAQREEEKERRRRKAEREKRQAQEAKDAADAERRLASAESNPSLQSLLQRFQKQVAADAQANEDLRGEIEP